VSTYKIVRFYKDDDELNKTVVATGLTLEQAQAHCDSYQSSSTTCTSAEGVLRTQQHGPWFDGYYEEA
jgi:hypothetical protein